MAAIGIGEEGDRSREPSLLVSWRPRETESSTGPGLRRRLVARLDVLLLPSAFLEVDRWRCLSLVLEFERTFAVDLEWLLLFRDFCIA